jgi:hypothetical protein
MKIHYFVHLKVKTAIEMLLDVTSGPASIIQVKDLPLPLSHNTRHFGNLTSQNALFVGWKEYETIFIYTS